MNKKEMEQALLSIEMIGVRGHSGEADKYMCPGCHKAVEIQGYHTGNVNYDEVQIPHYDWCPLKRVRNK